MMSKNDYRGFSKVFMFSFSQYLKSRINIVVTSLLCFAAFLIFPVVLYVSGDADGSGTDIDIDNIYICDKTGANLYDGIKNLTVKEYKNVTCHEKDFLPEELKEPNDKNDLYLSVTFDELSGFGICGIYDTKGSVTMEDADGYLQFLANNFKTIVLESSGVDEKKNDYINKTIDVKVSQIGNEKTSADDSENEVSYKVLFTFAFAAMFILAVCGERIATSIATEKTMKLAEYMLINIRPMALIMGKIAASMLMVFAQFFMVLMCGGISYLLFSDRNTSKVISGYIDMGSMQYKISFTGCVLAVVIFAAGFLMFGLIAGLAGAAVSKIENVGEGMKIYSILLVLGVYSAIFLPNAGFNETILQLCPITSVFILPANLVFGMADVKTALLSLLILMALIFILMIFVAGVYESMIFYNGETLKIGEIISMFDKKGRENKC